MPHPYKKGLARKAVSDVRRHLSAPLGHELIELLLVPRLAQTNQKLLEFALLFFQAAQCLGPVIVESLVAAGRAVGLPPGAAGLPRLHSTAPAVYVGIFPRTHPSAPPDA